MLSKKRSSKSRSRKTIRRKTRISKSRSRKTKSLEDILIAEDERDRKNVIKEDPLHKVKSMKIKNILEDPKLNKMTMELCKHKLISASNNKYNQAKADGETGFKKITSNKAEKICKCMFSKNGNLSIEEFINLTQNKEETPGSECIELL
jgi:hypothetical protein